MKSNSWTLALMKLVLHNDPATLLGDAAGLAGSASAGSVYVGLHLDDPGRAGSQTSSEATFSGYARAAVPRNPSRWVIELIDQDLGPVRASNAILIAFPECTGKQNEIRYASVGTSATGAGRILYSGRLVKPLLISDGIVPEFKPGDVSFTES